jgi:hypothetical protein
MGNYQRNSYGLQFLCYLVLWGVGIDVCGQVRYTTSVEVGRQVGFFREKTIANIVVMPAKAGIQK